MRSKFKWIFTLLVALTMQLSYAQEKTVKGIVTDASGPMPGVNVVVKGTSRSASTGFDGAYSIKASEGETLVFSFMGMNDISRVVETSSIINAKMQDEVTKLGEVVITGALGIKRKSDAVVSAQKQVNNKELTQAANPNVIQSLAGKVSGLQITNSSNGVNASSRIVLRGNRSLTGDNRALVVIDGAISSSDILSQLPPDIIESVNIIKGAQGAALYGSDGVNGAILVTTKRGSKSGKMTFGLTSAIDFENVAYVPQVQQDYGQGWATDPGFDDPSIPGVISTFVPFENGSWGPAFNTPGFPTSLPVGLPQADGNFLFADWKPIKNHIKQFFKTGTVLQNGFNFNVGGDDSYAFFSYNRQNSDFVVDGDKMVRNSFLFKAGKKLGKFSIDGNVNYITQSVSQTDPNLTDDLIQSNSRIPISRFANSGNEGNWTVYAQNPYWISKASRFDDKSNIFNGILSLGYELTKHVSVNNITNVQVQSTKGESHLDGYTPSVNQYNFAPYTYYGTSLYSYEDLGGTGTGSSYYANQSSSRNIYNDLVFNFNYDLTSKLNLKFNIGGNVQDRAFSVITNGGTNLDVAGFYHISNVLNLDNISRLDNRKVNYRKVGAFANVDLAYSDYLFLNATDRIEQSSTVEKSYMYPSVGLSFIPTKAFEMLKDSKLSYAKLNASYTSVGNTSAVGPYNTNTVAVIPQGFPFGNLAAFGFNFNPTNPKIKPEFVNTLEVGGQLGFFNDRINLEGSYFVAKTKDLISNATASSTSGANTLLNNIGNLENKGFEIDLGLVPVKTQNFRWDLRTSYSAAKTKITSLGDVTSINLQSNTSIGIFAEVGEDFPLIKGTSFTRDPDGNIIVDANGVPLRESQFKRLGKATPDYIVGLTNSFEYKGLKLTAVADFRTGGSVYSEAKNLLLFTGADYDATGFDRTQGYVVPGSVTSTGAVNTTTVANNPTYAGVLNYFTTTYRAVGEANVVDATALKIRELSLSYALPKKMIEKAGLQSFRFGINARNPFVFLADGKLIKPKNGLANNSYGDPESSNTAAGVGPQNNPFRAGFGNAQGIMNIGQYPTTKTYGFSINVTF